MYCEKYIEYPKGAAMRDVYNISDVLHHKIRRRLLELYINKFGRHEDRQQMELWATCNNFTTDYFHM